MIRWNSNKTIRTLNKNRIEMLRFKCLINLTMFKLVYQFNQLINVSTYLIQIYLNKIYFYQNQTFQFNNNQIIRMVISQILLMTLILMLTMLMHLILQSLTKIYLLNNLHLFLVEKIHQLELMEIISYLVLQLQTQQILLILLRI